MRGLTIREPWIDKILSGRKTWEIRTRKTNIRERIALIRGGTSTIDGYADLIDCFAMSRQELAGMAHYHNVPEADLASYGNPEADLFVWVLDNVEKISQPIPFQRPGGAVNWVTLS